MRSDINALVVNVFDAPGASEDMNFTTFGAQTRITIYGGARFSAPEASEDMSFTTFGAQTRITIY